MKMSTYERNFIDQAIIGYSDFHRFRPKSKVLSLHERKNLLDKNFEFNDENLLKIEQINELLHDKLLKAYNMAEVIEDLLISRMQLQDQFISDYEIDFRLSLFSKEKYSRIEDMEGNPFFCYEPLIIVYHKKDISSAKDIESYKESLRSTNFNEYPSGHPLHYQFHSAILHDLKEHTMLSWQDIIDIDQVWFEVILNVQNIEKLNLPT